MLQPMHSRISSSRPSAILRGRNGSAIEGRAAPTKSITPCRTRRSIVSGEVNRPTLTTGFCVACFTRDIAGGIGLHRAPPVQYIRPEIIGLVLGSLIAALELPASDEELLISLVEGDKDYLADVPPEEKEAYLRNHSYADFLYKKVGMSRLGGKLSEPWAQAMFGVGIESVSVAEGFYLGCPGIQAVGLPDDYTQTDEEVNPDIYRNPLFPDGNASVARLFVRKLAPDVAPGTTMQDLVTARFDYSQLDREDSNVRVRLNSTVVNAANRGSFSSHIYPLLF